MSSRNKGMKGLPKEIQEMVDKSLVLAEKREAQKKETWIKNVMRIQELEREEAEKLYEKLNK